MTDPQGLLVLRVPRRLHHRIRSGPVTDRPHELLGRWVRWTVAGDLLGMLPSALGSGLVESPRALVVLAGLLGGIVLLGSIGTAQWLELRRHISKAWTWIVTTAAAWLAGLVTFLLIAMPLWHPGQPPIVVVAIGLAAMATTVAVLTGLALQRLLRRRDREL